MTKDVLIRIRGLQIAEEDGDELEVITTGDYYQKNGKHYIRYDEVMEGFDGVIKNTMKIAPGYLDIIKKGILDSRMTFEQDKHNRSCYVTPLGDMMVGVNTNDICIQEEEDALKVEVKYSLDINYEHISNCSITVDICSKGKADLRLEP